MCLLLKHGIVFVNHNLKYIQFVLIIYFTFYIISVINDESYYRKII